MRKLLLTNLDFAELLAQEAEAAESRTKGRALRRASSATFMWPEEVTDLLGQKRTLTELHGVGPFVAALLQSWIDKPPKREAASELRNNFLTLTQARGILGTEPEWGKLYKGDLHMHTTWSDGSGTVREMAEAAMERGYEYIGIADHTQGLKIANGINEKQLAEQGKEIDDLNTSLKKEDKNFKVLKCSEMNLNPLGEGDMDPKALKKLDLVVGSFHSALRETEDQTERYIAALNNPDIQILGHPRGRVYNYRIGLKADWRKVFDHAAKLGKAVEINSFPDRQDLDGELLLLAKKAGCKISIDTDAHHTWQLGFIELGLAAALKAGIQKRNIINFMEAPTLVTWAKGLKRER